MQLIHIWFSFKQWFSVIKFCHDTPNAPNVHGCGITGVKENFWSSVPQCYNLQQIIEETYIEEELNVLYMVLIVNLYSTLGNERAWFFFKFRFLSFVNYSVLQLLFSPNLVVFLLWDTDRALLWTIQANGFFNFFLNFFKFIYLIYICIFFIFITITFFPDLWIHLYLVIEL